MDEISKIVRNFRLGKGWTQEKLAELLEIDQTTVSRIEVGISEPGKRLAKKLATLTNRPLDVFIR